jgi:flagellar assembly factor FliW
MTADTMTDGGTILFEDGLPGFPDAHRFTIVEMIEDGAFQLLQSNDDPDLAFVVAVPWLFFPDYSPELSDVDQTGLGIESTEDAVLFCPVTLDGETRTASMNLLGPFVVNVHTRRGRQLVLTEQEFPIRATLPVEIG